MVELPDLIENNLLDFIHCLDLQLDTYLCTWNDESGLPASLRVLYNIIKRPGERRKQKETLTQFGTRIAENAAAKPDEHAACSPEMEIDLIDIVKRTLEFNAPRFIRRSFLC
jgi:hypothetical protein